MGLLDMIRPQNTGEDRGQWSDVPLGFRLGLLGQIIASAGSGQPVPMTGFAAMQAMTQDKIEGRKTKKQLELASRYLEKRPDLKPLVESGAISVADIIKMDREDAKLEESRKYDKENWLFQQGFLIDKEKEQAAIEAAAAKKAEEEKRLAEYQDWLRKEQFKMENDPNRQWWQEFSGGMQPQPAVEAPVPGVRPTPGAATPGPTPGAPETANNPVVQRMREVTKDPSLTEQEANYLFQTVRNPDDFRTAYDNILKNRIEARKAKAEEDKLAAEKAEAKKKAVDAKAAEDSGRMVAVAAIDKTLDAMDKSNLPTAGTVGYMLSGLPGTGAFEASTNIETLKSYISLDKLTQMRQNSSTGASGLGQVTNYEQRMLAASEGSINQGLDEDTLRNNLKEVRARIIAFNTPSKEDPTKSQLTVDSEKLANNPTPEVVAAFEEKYGIGSASVITGETSPATERSGPPSVVDDPEIDDILNQYPQAGGN